MPALRNLDHEQFCQNVHARMAKGEKRVDAITAAYRDTMYRGDNPDDDAIKPNARRLANSAPVVARLKELSERAAQLAALDAGWALVELKKIVDAAKAFTLDDYLARDEHGNRKTAVDLTRATPEQIERLLEVAPEVLVTLDKEGNETVRTKVKIKGPDKFAVIPATIARMAEIAGWKAPTKVAATDAKGDDLGLAELIGASMRPKDTKEAA